MSTMLAGSMNQIWQQIWSMLFNDAYFRVFEHARQITGEFNGTFTAVIHDGYLTFQLVAIRRLGDGRTDVVVASTCASSDQGTSARIGEAG